MTYLTLRDGRRWAARHMQGLSTGQCWARKRRRTRRRGRTPRDSICQDRSNRTAPASRCGRATCSVDGRQVWLGLEISSHFLSIRLVRDVQSGIMSLARRFSAIAPAARRNRIHTQSIQPAAPMPARHCAQAAPMLPTQTAPQAISAPPHAIALKTSQPEGVTPAPTGPRPDLRRTGALCVGNLIVVLLFVEPNAP